MLRNMTFVLKFSLTAVIGFFMLMNIQPWVYAVSMLLNNVPMLSGILTVLGNIPLLGWLFQFIGANLAVLAGFVIWLVVQLIQIIPTLIERPQTLKILIRGVEDQGVTERRDGSRLDGLRRRVNDWLAKIIDNLKFYRAVAYCIEALVCLVTYPPYKGGWGKLVSDYPVFDWEAIDFVNIALMLVTMFAFEVLFRVVLNVWGLAEIANRATRKPA
jgi:hypothetical protein